MKRSSIYALNKKDPDAIVYRDANGLYWQTKFRYIFSSVFNAVISVVFVGPLHMGVTGALLGTTASLPPCFSQEIGDILPYIFPAACAGAGNGRPGIRPVPALRRLYCGELSGPGSRVRLGAQRPVVSHLPPGSPVRLSSGYRHEPDE